MIMSARVLAGWIKAEDLLPPAEEVAEGDAGAEATEGEEAKPASEG
jgi:hypothetical protein